MHVCDTNVHFLLVQHKQKCSCFCLFVCFVFCRAPPHTLRLWESFSDSQPEPIPHSILCHAWDSVGHLSWTKLVLLFFLSHSGHTHTHRSYDGLVPLPHSQDQRWEQRPADDQCRVHGHAEWGRWKAGRRFSVSIRRVHWKRQCHLPHVPGHWQNTTRWVFVLN